MPTLRLVRPHPSLYSHKYDLFHRLKSLHDHLVRHVRRYATGLDERVFKSHQRLVHTNGLEKGAEKRGPQESQHGLKPVEEPKAKMAKETEEPTAKCTELKEESGQRKMDGNIATPAVNRERTQVEANFFRKVNRGYAKSWGIPEMRRIFVPERPLAPEGALGNESEAFGPETGPETGPEAMPFFLGKYPLNNSSPRSSRLDPKGALSLLDTVARGQAKKTERWKQQEEEATGSEVSKASGRVVYNMNEGHKSIKIDYNQSSPPVHTLSLFEELFPEEAKGGHKRKTRLNEERRKTTSPVGGQQDDVPRLPPPDLDTSHDPIRMQTPKLLAREAEMNAFRENNPTVLVLSGVSLSLVESDFRRISPKGIHIEEWRGLGDNLKGKFVTLNVASYIYLTPYSYTWKKSKYALTRTALLSCFH